MVYRLIREVGQERLAVAFVRVNPADHLVGIGAARIEVGWQFHLFESIEEMRGSWVRRGVRLLLVIIGAALGKHKRLVETLRRRQAFFGIAEVPLARHISVVSGALQERGNGYGPTVQAPLVSRLAALI